jgi:hypothetical protein
MRRVLEGQAPELLEWRGPAFRFEQDPAARARLVERAAGVECLDPGDPTVRARIAESFGGAAGVLARRTPCFAVLEADRVVSVAYTAAGADGRSAEVGVDTARDRLGHGHAVRCVAAWALAQLASNVQPLYSTRWSNHASLAVARKLELILYGEDLHWT